MHGHQGKPEEFEKTTTKRDSQYKFKSVQIARKSRDGFLQALPGVLLYSLE